MHQDNLSSFSPTRRLLSAIGVMSATLMQVLDQTIANVALPHMQAALGATQESVSWVLTSYILATAIAIPMTGWVAAKVGVRRLFIIATIGFTIMSMACGLAQSLVEMVIFRALQGACGAFLVPLSQSVMYGMYSAEKRGQAMSIWSMGVMIGPILGPVLGGWLTDQFDWRWVFFINVPFGLVAIWLMTLLPDFPTERRKFDFLGFAFLGVGLSALQLMLDRGSSQDWFNSWEILIEFGIAIACGWMFIVHTITAREPLLSRKLFLDRNLSISVFFIMITSGLLIAGAVLTSPMLQRLLGYDATEAGFVTIPRGIAMMVSMLIAGRIVNLVELRVIMVFGLALTAYSLWMMTGFTLDMDSHLVIVSGLIQGFGFGFVILPLNMLAFSTISDKLRTDGAALYSLGRSIGGSIAIAILTALLARSQQTSHSDLSAHFTAMTLPYLNTAMSQQLAAEGIPIASMIDLEINRQALMIAYINDFYIMFWATILVMPLIFFLRKPEHFGNPAEMVSE